MSLLPADETFMAEAIRVAERGLYTSMPNPRVGCCLVRDGQILAKGYHAQTGQAHAEAHALQQLREQGVSPKGATAYVTMEPCSYHGRTPSCAKSLVAAGIKRVVAAMTDPHPKNQGLGFKILTDAGIETQSGVLEASARALNPGHINKFEQQRPYVRLKLAMTLDGKTALNNGASQWITGPAARADVQLLRARSSAIITGVQTVIDDDPALTVRAKQLPLAADLANKSEQVQRKIVVLDSMARIPASAQLRANPNLHLISSEAAPHLPGIEQSQVGTSAEGLDLTQVLALLAEMDCNEVLFECGATLAGSLLKARLVDELVLYTAPKLMGSGARSLVAWPDLESMADVPELEFSDVRILGPDLKITAKPKY